MRKVPRRRAPLIEVRHSPIHGYGVFAARRIRKGTTVIEYLGERVSHAEADARYEDKDPNDNHTFLFTVDSKTVIDAGVNGNEARYINHRCDPNCESTTINKRIFIEAIRTVQPGEELAYDYQIQRDDDDAPNVDEIYACRCGAASCRGSMLEPAKRPRKPEKRAGKSEKPRSKEAARSRKAVRDEKTSRGTGSERGRNAARPENTARGRSTRPHTKAPGRSQRRGR